MSTQVLGTGRSLLRTRVRHRMADEELHLIGPDEIAYRLDLTPAQLKITYTALKSFLDDFGHDERDVHDVVREVLAKLPDEHAIRAIDITQGPVAPGCRRTGHASRRRPRATDVSRRDLLRAGGAGAARPDAMLGRRRRGRSGPCAHERGGGGDGQPAGGPHLRPPCAHRDLGQGGGARAALPERLSRGHAHDPGPAVDHGGKRGPSRSAAGARTGATCRRSRAGSRSAATARCGPRRSARPAGRPGT